MGITRAQGRDNVREVTVRRMVRAMTHYHWSIAETLDEYDIPDVERASYIELIGAEFLAD